MATKVWYEIVQFIPYRGWVEAVGPIGKYSDLFYAEEDWEIWDLDNQPGIQYRLIKVTETVETEIVKG